MIKNHDRSKWFGASDTHFIMGKWNTKTFAKWWCVKLGILKNNFQTKETMAGNAYEHKIAKAIESKLNIKLKLDRQLKCRKYKVRVNLDSETKERIYEIKTFKEQENWCPTKNYEMQLQVQMYFTKKKGTIAAYPMNEKNYKNYFLPIDLDKLKFFDFELDNEFIKDYLIRVEYLKKCLKNGVLPKIEDIKEKYE
jgi:hypothetical protein